MATENFTAWLYEQLNARDWSMNELARRADISSGAISLVMSGQRGPGPDVCLGIARALQLPPETVFRKAGLLPPTSEPEEPMTLQRAAFLFSHLNGDEQDAVLALMEKLVEDRIRDRNGRLVTPQSKPA